MGNSNLHRARTNKQDEFYTQLVDIEKEVMHYRPHFKGKTVYLNCDDPRESNFFKYFSYNFERLGLKKLIASCYKSQDYDLFSLHDVNEKAVWLEYTGENDGGRVPTVEAIGIHYFEGDGDFRSEESIELLKEADIVVTNPPFSLFKEFVSVMVEHNKDFLIIGTMNVITYNDIFPLLKDGKLWLGVNNGDMSFRVPDSYEERETRFWIDEEGKKWRSLGNTSWYTNLDYRHRHEDLILYKKYNKEEYPKYDDFNAINVDKLTDIPKNYSGIMGVPITIMTKHNPNQFEILGKIDSGKIDDYNIGNPIVDGVAKYKRIAIRNKYLQDIQEPKEDN